ncbi:helix-turn-helix transcriptional regulator [Streptomyces sp. NPDC046859]|uniref:helix-turn-helix domain-containing protein n=1 Tax=Streptomyces sp. NPDC046859 TaxID=3155734 RepID=UPI0033C19E5E
MRVMTRERDWEKLGKAYAAARKTIGLTQPDAADQLHVSRTTIQAIERGRQSNGTPFDKVTATMRAYARLVGWTETSPGVVLAGGEPEQAPETEAAADTPRSDLPPAVDRELRSGKTLDTTVVHLGDEDDDTRIIVVLKGGDSMTEEEIDEAWQKWRRTRRHLQAIPGESDTPPEA